MLTSTFLIVYGHCGTIFFISTSYYSPCARPLSHLPLHPPPPPPPRAQSCLRELRTADPYSELLVIFIDITAVQKPPLPPQKDVLPIPTPRQPVSD